MNKKLSEKYRDFVLGNIVEDNIKVILPKPTEDGKLMWILIGSSATIDVKLEVVEKYTRSTKINLIFDRYEVEQLFFFSLNSAPNTIKEKIYNKISEIVSDTFFGDNRHEDVLRMYKEKEEMIWNNFSLVANKLKTDKK